MVREASDKINASKESVVRSLFIKSLIKLNNLIKKFELNIGNNNIYGEDIEQTEILKYGKFFIFSQVFFLSESVNITIFKSV